MTWAGSSDPEVQAEPEEAALTKIMLQQEKGPRSIMEAE